MSLFHRKKKSTQIDGLDQARWSEADQALAKTRLESARAMAEWPTVERVHKALSEQLEQNNFAERIRLTMRGN